MGRGANKRSAREHQTPSPGEGPSISTVGKEGMTVARTNQAEHTHSVHTHIHEQEEHLCPPQIPA